MVNQQIRGRLRPNVINRRDKAIKKALDASITVSDEVRGEILKMKKVLKTIVKEVQEEEQLRKFIDSEYRGPVWNKGKGYDKEKRKHYNAFWNACEDYGEALKKEKGKLKKEERYISREAKSIRKEIKEWEEVLVKLHTIINELSIHEESHKTARETPIGKIRKQMEKVLRYAKRVAHQQAYVERWDRRDAKVELSISKIKNKMGVLEDELKRAYPDQYG